MNKLIIGNLDHGTVLLVDQKSMCDGAVTRSDGHGQDKRIMTITGSRFALCPITTSVCLALYFKYSCA